MTRVFAKHTCQQFAPCWVSFFCPLNASLTSCFIKKGAQLIWSRKYYIVSRVSYPCQVCQKPPVWRMITQTFAALSSCNSNEGIGEKIPKFVSFVGILHSFFILTLCFSELTNISHELKEQCYWQIQKTQHILHFKVPSMDE